MLTESNSLSATPNNFPVDSEHSAQYPVHTNLPPLRIFTHINSLHPPVRCLFEKLRFQQF